MILPMTLSDSDVVLVSKKESTFVKSGLFPLDNEKIRIGELNKKGKMSQPNLYLQFYPSKVPSINSKLPLLAPKNEILSTFTQVQPFMTSVLDKVQLLNEVIIATQKKKTRLEHLQKRSYGTIDIFDDQKRLYNRSLSIYLSGRGYAVSNYGGVLTITVRNPNTPNNNIPILYLDGVQILDFGFLANFDMNTVDYIDINKSGLGEGINGGAGTIKIFTDPEIFTTASTYQSFKTYEVPLTFSAPEKFYVPKYQFYQSQFFNEYGVIDWLPNVSFDDDNNLDFTILNTGTGRIDLYIEGLTDDGEFISEIKTITID
jgi:hypothetical protein